MARQYFFTGSAAPTTAPTYAGSLFVDTTGGKIYFATGTTSSADWDPLPINLSDLTIDSDLALGGLYKIKKALGMDFQPASELTIATGAVTQTQSVHTVDTQSDAASDDLDTITIATDMSVLLLTLENAARIVTLKHGTGNLNLPDDADIVMAENTVYFLLYNGTAWNLVGSSASGGGAGSDTTAIHDNVAGEIAAITNKATPVNGDLILIEDSADSNNKKHVLASNFLAGSGDVSASANITDNAIVRGDGGSKGVQESGILIDDSDNVSGVGTLTMNAFNLSNSSGTPLIFCTRSTGVAPSNGTGIFRLQSNAYNGTTNVNSAEFLFRATETWNGTSRGSEILMKVVNNATTSTVTALTLNQDATALFSNNLLLTDQAAPSSPSSGELAIYSDSTSGLPTAKNSSGDVMQLSNGVYKTISFNAGGMTPRTTNGAASGTKEYTTNDIDLDFFDFDAATNEGVQVALMLDDDYDLSTVKFKFIWTTATTAGTGNVVWGVRAVAISNDSPLDAAFGTAQTVTDGFLLADDNHTTAATPAVTIGGTPVLGDLVVFEFYRDAANGSDTYTQDARLLNVTMQYKTLDTTTAAW